MIDPAVTLVLTDNWIEFNVRYITNYKLRRAIQDRLFGLILEEFEKTEGQVKIASTTMQLVDTPPLTVGLPENCRSRDRPSELITSFVSHLYLEYISSF
jgi:hypothetical protein